MVLLATSVSFLLQSLLSESSASTNYWYQTKTVPSDAIQQSTSHVFTFRYQNCLPCLKINITNNSYLARARNVPAGVLRGATIAPLGPSPKKPGPASTLTSSSSQQVDPGASRRSMSDETFHMVSLNKTEPQSVHKFALIQPQENI